MLTDYCRLETGFDSTRVDTRENSDPVLELVGLDLLVHLIHLISS